MPPKRKRPVVKNEADGDANNTATGAKKKKLQGASNNQGDDNEEAPKMKKILVKGKAPVDPECKAKIGKAHVYCEGTDIYDAMLNQTNVQYNNNKYYIIQVLRDDGSKNFSVWYRWGRVGKVGQSKLESHGTDLERAKESFMKKFFDKTKNHWDDRNDFTKVPGKYDLLEMDYSSKDEEKKEKVKKEHVKKESTLPDVLQNLLTWICDIQTMEDAVLEMQYDSKKAPLGRLTKAQIKAGYAALKAVDNAIKKGETTNKGLLQACNDFYTRIPHDFGMRVPPLIRTPQEVRMKLELLEALGDIEIAMNLISKPDTDESPIDRNYRSLECDIKPLGSQEAEYKLISDYLVNTQGPTHSGYKLELLEVFACTKPKEIERFNDVGNRMLLWHGSRLSNWMGILNQGLRIAPPEAPVTGYMFGKGVYFADVSTKSANYVYPTRAKNTGILLLCEVALGNCNELLAADYSADKLPKGKHSVKGMGKLVPHSTKNHTSEDGMVIPLGKTVDSGVSNPSGYTLNYNEYVVYDARQIKMRYLVKVKFNFK